jgi:hypothetical protein
MPWIKMTSLTGQAQYFNSANLIVLRAASGLDAAPGARSTLWMQAGKAQVRETPDEIIKQLGPAWVELTSPAGTPIYFYPDSCTEVLDLISNEKNMEKNAARTKVRTENEEFVVRESVGQVINALDGQTRGPAALAVRPPSRPRRKTKSKK